MSVTTLTEWLTERMQISGLLMYPHLTHPHPRIVSPAGRRYSATLIPPIRALFDIEAAIQRVALSAWGPTIAYHSTLRFKERVRDGSWCVTATSKNVPTCCDETGQERNGYEHERRRGVAALRRHREA